MYGALWRALPGPAWLRVILLIILAGAVLYALVTWGFPWVQQFIDGQEEITIQE